MGIDPVLMRGDAEIGDLAAAGEGVPDLCDIEVDGVDLAASLAFTSV